MEKNSQNKYTSSSNSSSSSSSNNTNTILENETNFLKNKLKESQQSFDSIINKWNSPNLKKEIESNKSNLSDYHYDRLQKYANKNYSQEQLIQKNKKKYF